MTITMTDTVDVASWEEAGWRLAEPCNAVAVLLEPPTAQPEKLHQWVPDKALLTSLLEQVKEASDQGEPPWFPSDDWLSGEDEVDEHIRAGNIREFTSPEELIAHLQGRVDEQARSENPDHPEVR